MGVKAISRRPRRPDVAGYAENRDKQTWKWIEGRVLPYLQSLLDSAQRRLSRHPICFQDAMGMSCFYVDNIAAIRDYQFDDAISKAATAKATGSAPVGGRRLNDRDARYAARFPELVEFMCIVNDLNERLDQSIGAMNPSVTLNPEEKA